MWGAIIQLLLGLGTAGYNAYKQKQIKDKLNGMQDPEYAIPQGYKDNLSLAQSEAQYGFSPQTITNLQNQFASNLASSNQAILQGGGSVNDIAKMYGVFTDKTQALAIQDEALRNQKMNNLLQATSTMAGQEALKWKINMYDRIRNQKALASALLTQTGQGKNQGLNMAMQGGIGLVNYYQNNNMGNDYNKMMKNILNENTPNGNPNIPSYYTQEIMPTAPDQIASPLYANNYDTNNAIQLNTKPIF